MHRTITALALVIPLAASLSPTFAIAADASPATAASAEQAQPPGPPPASVPTAPPADLPPPEARPLEAHPGPTVARAAKMPNGQWIYTQQYGWVWPPFDAQYTHVADDAALAYQYVWYPSFGWTWVVAPWVLGLGVAPHWGALGPGHFAWYAHPWFRLGTEHLRPSWGPGLQPRGFVRGVVGAHHGRR